MKAGIILAKNVFFYGEEILTYRQQCLVGSWITRRRQRRRQSSMMMIMLFHQSSVPLVPFLRAVPPHRRFPNILDQIQCCFVLWYLWSDIMMMMTMMRCDVNKNLLWILDLILISFFAGRITPVTWEALGPDL